jgi:Calcineurin-like phosphoesterase
VNPDRTALPRLLLVVTLLSLGAVVGIPGVEPQQASATTHVLIAAAGDIACDPASASFKGGAGTAARCAQMRTSQLLVDREEQLDQVLVLGDAQYECGGAQAFAQSFDPSWGQVKSLIKPAIGNHEYKVRGGTDCDTTGQADGYFDYFGTAAGDRDEGYYSFNLSGWHLVALNSNCRFVGGCGRTSPQGQWFADVLASNAAECTLVYDHHPRWSGGEHGSIKSMSYFYRTLFNDDGEIFLSGHDHDYEVFKKQAPDGTVHPEGVRQFVSGAGGKSHYEVTPLPNTQYHNDTDFGVLFLTLGADSYSWQFISEDNVVLDEGSTACHN